MKKFISFTLVLALVTSISQAQGTLTAPSVMAPEGTSLGANETIAYNGIALGNRVKMRGFVDFIFAYQDEDISGDSADFSDTAADIDFLLDFSPVTAEIHLATASGSDVSLEQAFGRYSFNQDFSVTFGRQLTALGFDADEAPGLYAVTPAYTIGGLTSNYVDGARLNFNNGQFGLVLGLHDTYGWTSNTNLGEGVAIDIAASAMIVPGLEARLGFAYEDVEDVDDSISQINTFLSYSANNLTLALEYDNYNIYGSTLWDIMVMANYSFTDWVAATLRYSHEDNEVSALNYESANRYTLAFLFTLTDNLYFNFEYSHAQRELLGGGDDDLNELYLEALLTF
ncbi:MAG: outer membrane beta-barrel protein [Verrucomicrobiota bacterium]|nr:outer membrane beta-barrel protein [Verrucomicrobiota bacterium]